MNRTAMKPVFDVYDCRREIARWTLADRVAAPATDDLGYCLDAIDVVPAGSHLAAPHDRPDLRGVASGAPVRLVG